MLGSKKLFGLSRQFARFAITQPSITSSKPLFPVRNLATQVQAEPDLYDKLRFAVREGDRHKVSLALAESQYTLNELGLLFACSHENSNIVKDILANKHIITNDGFGAAFYVSVKRENPSIIKMLLEEDKDCTKISLAYINQAISYNSPDETISALLNTRKEQILDNKSKIDWDKLTAKYPVEYKRLIF